MVATTTGERTLELVDETCAPTQGRELPAAEAEQIADLLKALADPVRLRLFVRLATSPDEVCVCDFPDVGVSQPTVSHHLKKLRETGLVESERRGTWVYYRPVEGVLSQLGSFISGLGAHVERAIPSGARDQLVVGAPERSAVSQAKNRCPSGARTT